MKVKAQDLRVGKKVLFWGEFRQVQTLQKLKTCIIATVDSVSGDQMFALNQELEVQG